MISTLAVANYRSLRNIVAPLGALNLVSVAARMSALVELDRP